MKTCLFCRNTRIFNIHNDYGNSSHTAKDDMFEFFGYQIEDHLRPDDAICNLCMNIMDNVAKLKRRLLPLIFRSEPADMEDQKPINFGKKWDVFASMNFDEDIPFLESRSPTPSNLVTCKKIVPYETPEEIKIAQIERQRSTSRCSVAKSDADSEIVKVFAKKTRKRKKGHNWTRRKNSRYSSASTDRKSVASSYNYQSYSAYSKSRSPSPMSTKSTDSHESFYLPDSPERSSPIHTVGTHILTYVDGCLQNKRTRSVSRLQEEEMSIYLKGGELHPCPEPGCTFICEDIDLMVKHKINRHHQLALFWCNFCKNNYTSSVDLEIHKRLHSAEYSCVICHREFFYDTDLKEHWQGHVEKSVPCKFCGKRFVDKNVCNKHQRNVHRRNIPSRIDYSDTDVKTNNAENKDFEVRILVQGPNMRED